MLQAAVLSSSGPNPLWRLSCALEQGIAVCLLCSFQRGERAEAFILGGYETRNDETKCIEMQAGQVEGSYKELNSIFFGVYRQRVGLWRNWAIEISVFRL